MAERAVLCGPSTPRYKVVQGHFYPLVLNFEQVLTQLAPKCFERSLISEHDLQRASNPRQPAFERSSALLKKILKKIECEQRMYEVFVSVLHEISELKDIASELEIALRKEEDCSNASPVLSQRHSSRRSSKLTRSRPLSRRYSDSDIVKSKSDDVSEDSAELDSGVSKDVQVSSYLGGDSLQEEAELDDSSAFEDEQPKLLCVNEPGQTVDQPAPTLGYPHAANGSTSSADSAPLATYNIESDDEGLQPPIERTLSDGKVSIPPHLDSLVNQSGENWSRKAESIYLKSENQQQASQICDLNEAIDILKEEKENSAEKLKQQGIKINRKDEEIKSLKKDYAEKDKRVEVLIKDKAEMEKTIYNLRARCSEAEMKQAKSEEEIKSIHESYQDRLLELEKDLEDVKSREKNAQIELAEAETRLVQAKLEKEREITKLKDEYFKQKEIVFHLKLSMQDLEEEKRRECLVKDKEMALKEKELAEVKESHAKEAESRAKEETKQAVNERRSSELKVAELTKELEKLRCEHSEREQNG